MKILLNGAYYLKMELFTATLNQMGVLGLYMVIGFIIAKLKIVPKEASKVLSKLENAVFLPALVLYTFLSNFTVATLRESWLPLLISLGVEIIVIPVAILTSRLATKDGFIRRMYTYGLCFSNFGFMGNAVVSALFPDIFLEYLIFTLPLWILIYLWGVPSLLISDGSKRSLGQKMKSFVNPMFIAMIIGMIIGISGLKLPGWTTSVISTAGDCMSPIAMLLTGITVAGISLKKVFTNVGVWVVSVVRLIIFPLIFIGLFYVLPLPGSLDTFVICAVCSLAMPLGLNTIVIPSAYGRDTTVASGMALISHLLSCLTIPLIFMLFNALL
jgi:predicted permease